MFCYDGYMTSGLLSTGKSNTGKMTTGIGPRPVYPWTTFRATIDKQISGPDYHHWGPGPRHKIFYGPIMVAPHR